MPLYRLIEDLYLLPTAAGAFHAVSGAEDTPVRRLLLSLLCDSTSPEADAGRICQWSGINDEQKALQLLHHSQKRAWIQGYQTPRLLSEHKIGQQLEGLLGHLSSTGKGLLVDWNGLPLARCGIDDETAEALSALSADLAAVQTRHFKRLTTTLGLSTQGWAAIDTHGTSRIGAWPLFIGDKRFLLVLTGEPRMDQPELTRLLWILVHRYAELNVRTTAA